MTFKFSFRLIKEYELRHKQLKNIFRALIIFLLKNVKAKYKFDICILFIRKILTIH